MAEDRTRRNLTRTEIKRLERKWRSRIERPVALLLDSVQTPPNVGSIIRTAAAFRVDDIYLAGATASPSHPKAAKTSLGTERQVTWTVHPKIAEAISQVRADGYTLIGVELGDDATPLPALGSWPDKPICLAVGQEQHGLSTTALKECDQLVYIPTAGKAVPLNVATAASIALYEVRRSEWLSDIHEQEQALEGQT